MNEKESILNRLIRAPWLPFAIIAVVIGLLYQKSLSFLFTVAESKALVQESVDFLSSNASIFELFNSPLLPGLYDFYYRPVLMLSFIFDASLGGNLPVHFHLTNILLHVAASWLLFLLLKKFGYGRWLSLTCTLVFAVHPALVGAVAWVLGRNDSLMAVFVLLSFIAFLASLDGFKKRYLALHAFALALALLSKETAVMCVPVFFLYMTAVEPRKTSVRQKCIVSAVWAFIIAAWFALRLSSEGLKWVSVWEMLRTILDSSMALVLYVSKSVVPANLSVRPWPIDFDAWFAFPTIAFVLMGAVIARPGTRKRICFGVAWFLLFLVPAVISRSSYFEHRIYLPIIGLFMILPEIYLALRDRYPFARKVMELSALPIIAVFFLIASVHRDDYVSVVSYWENASSTVPSSLEAQANLARVYYSDYGDAARAEEAFEKCRKLDPYDFDSTIDLCNVLIAGQRYEEAEALFKEMLIRNTGFKKVAKDLVYYYYAGLCRKQGRDLEAEQFYRKALALNPHVIDYYRAIITYYEHRDNSTLSAYYLSLFKQELRSSAGRIRYIEDTSREWAKRR